MNVVPLRKQYRSESDLGARKEMAKQEFDYWHGYLLSRKEEIAGLEEKRRALEEDVEGQEAHKDTLLHYRHAITSDDRGLLEDYFDRFKDRKSHKIPAEKMTDFHGEFSKMFKFKVPLHPKNLSQLVHPFHGYLTAFRGQAFNFEELLALYENQIAASFEKTFGRELLGDELSCLSFWLIQDESKKGWLTLEEFKGLLYAF